MLDLRKGRHGNANNLAELDAEPLTFCHHLLMMQVSKKAMGFA